ncbi:MAG: O-antigen ligase C-terminal domain-containing protein [Rubrivivax sp.]|nr:O-antigen ligase C-terminal domain-containing protein [Rubrivivax sp.]
MLSTAPVRQRAVDRANQWQARLRDVSLPLILASATLATAWLLPGHFLPWPSFQQEAVAAAAGLLFCWASLQWRSGMPLRWPVLCWVPALLACTPWLQFASGQVRFLDDALLPSLYLVALALSICVGATLGQSGLRGQLLEGFTAAAVTAGILSVGIALWQWLSLDPFSDWLGELPPGGRPYANLGQPNHLSTLLVIALAGILRWYETRRLGAFTGVLAAAWLGLGIALTQSRTGWLCIAVLVAGCLLLRRRAALRTSPAAAVGLGLLFSLFVNLAASLQSLLLLGAAPALRTEAGTRLEHWKVLGDAALHAPWFGYGWNQVSMAQYEFAPRHAAVGEYLLHSHNLVLDLALYCGLPVALLVTLGLAAWGLRTLRTCRDGQRWALLAVWLALLTHAMLEYPLHYLYFLLPAGLLMGVLHVPAARGPWSQQSLPRVVLWAAPLALAVMLGLVTIEYMRIEESLRRLRFAVARIGTTTTAGLTSPEVHLLPLWKRYHDATVTQPRAGMSAQEMRLVADLAQRYSYVPSLQRYAVALGLNGQPEEARAVLGRICKIYREPFLGGARTAWEERRKKDVALAGIAFPDCQQ